ncbi:MAG: Abi family protein [Alphaproteobacteria bacterium]|jgi:abortive infection bacteriophage resistance protein|nr:Abi family protein [Alphaproteobacteria bacterium]
MSQSNQKPWLSIEEQIQLLKDRNLIIENEIYAKNILSRISYYRLISYRFPFCQEKDKNIFKDGTKFEDLVNLYNKDSEYQALLYQVLKEIEIFFRTQLIYCFAKQDIWFYKDRSKLNQKDKEAKRNVDSYIKKMNDSVCNETNVHISYYIEQHDKGIAPYKIPNCKYSYKEMGLLCNKCRKKGEKLDSTCSDDKCNGRIVKVRLCKCYPKAWVSLESFDFGMLIDLYSGINGFINKSEISSKYLECDIEFGKFFNIDEKYLYNKDKRPFLDLLRDIKVIRNIIAHHDKVIDRYSFKEAKSIDFLKIHYEKDNKVLELLNDMNTYRHTFLPYFLVIKYFLDIMFQKDPNLGYQVNIFTRFLDFSKLNTEILSLDNLPKEVFEPSRERTVIS